MEKKAHLIISLICFHYILTFSTTTLKSLLVVCLNGKNSVLQIMGLDHLKVVHMFLLNSFHLFDMLGQSSETI